MAGPWEAFAPERGPWEEFAAPEENYNQWTGAAKAIGTGALKGVIGGTVGLPGDLEQFAQWGYKELTGNEPWERKSPDWLTSKGWTDPIKGIASALIHRPQNAKERYLEAGTEGVASMLNPVGVVGKGRMLTKGSAVLGGMMGLGGEVGREVLPEHQVAGTLAGSLLPLTAQLFLHGRTPNTVKSVGPYAEIIGEKGFTDAAARARAATEATGVPTLLNQGFPYANPLDRAAMEVAGSRHGKAVVDVVQKQRAAEGPLIRGFPDKITPLQTDIAVGSRELYENNAKMLNSAKSPSKYKEVAENFIAEKGPDEFVRTVKREFEQAAEEVTRQATAGRQKANTLTAFVNKIAGREGSDQRRVFMTKIALLKKQRGMSDEAAAAVAEKASKYMDALLVLDSGRPPVHNLSEFGEEAGRSLVTDAMMASWVAPIRITGQRGQKMLKRGSFKAFADALTSPGGEQKFIDIANYGPWSQRAQAALQGIIQESAMINAAPEPGKPPFSLPEFFGGINQE